MESQKNSSKRIHGTRNIKGSPLGRSKMTSHENMDLLKEKYEGMASKQVNIYLLLNI